jgi:hypothetical protein
MRWRSTPLAVTSMLRRRTSMGSRGRALRACPRQQPRPAPVGVGLAHRIGSGPPVSPLHREGLTNHPYGTSALGSGRPAVAGVGVPFEVPYRGCRRRRIVALVGDTNNSLSMSFGEKFAAEGSRLAPNAVKAEQNGCAVENAWETGHLTNGCGSIRGRRFGAHRFPGRRRGPLPQKRCRNRAVG